MVLNRWRLETEPSAANAIDRKGAAAAAASDKREKVLQLAERTKLTRKLRAELNAVAGVVRR